MTQPRFKSFNPSVHSGGVTGAFCFFFFENFFFMLLDIGFLFTDTGEELSGIDSMFFERFVFTDRAFLIALASLTADGFGKDRAFL